MSRPRFEYSIKGMIYGVKVNRKNSLDVLKTRTTQVQARMTKVATQAVERRVKNGSFQEKLIKGGKGVQGTEQFESTPAFHGKYNHTPHEDVKDPLTRVINYGLKVTVKSLARKGVFAKAEISDNRITQVRFYDNQPGDHPKVSTVWDRLDKTCLPFVSNGNYEKLVKLWSRSTQRAIQRGFLKEFKGDMRKAPKVDR